MRSYHQPLRRHGSIRARHIFPITQLISQTIHPRQSDHPSKTTSADKYKLVSPASATGSTVVRNRNSCLCLCKENICRTLFKIRECRVQINRSLSVICEFSISSMRNEILESHLKVEWVGLLWFSTHVSRFSFIT